MNRIRTDVGAETHARQQIGRHAVDTLNHHRYAIKFERYVNEHGVPVRRVVMYGPEECDPSVPAVEPAAAVA